MVTRYIKKNMKPDGDVLDITPELTDIVRREALADGILFLSVIGSTSAITTMEYEPGLVRDLAGMLSEVIPYRKDYFHNSAWADDNGHSHLRSSIFKTGFFVSVTSGKLDLGTWQQVVLINFDTRPRERTVVVKIIT